MDSKHIHERRLQATLSSHGLGQAALAAVDPALIVIVKSLARAAADRDHDAAIAMQRTAPN